MLQLVHTPAPLTLNLPSGHISAVAFVDPATQACPALQLPLHAADGRPAVAPYVPAGHALHTPALPTLYRPAVHIAAVALVDPATQACPALQLPLHPAEVRPSVAPYVPAGHGAVQEADARAVVAPYRPALQFVQVLDPATLNLPARHTDAVGDVDPAIQKCPALQLPLQPAVVMPDTPPYRPALHSVHTPTPPKLY